MSTVTAENLPYTEGTESDYDDNERTFFAMMVTVVYTLEISRLATWMARAASEQPICKDTHMQTCGLIAAGAGTQTSALIFPTPAATVRIAPARGETYHRSKECRWIACANATRSYTPCAYCG